MQSQGMNYELVRNEVQLALDYSQHEICINITPFP